MPTSPRPQTTPSLPDSVQPSPQILGRSSNALRTLHILTLAALGMAILLALLPAAGHDQLWFLLMARRWLDGASLYGPYAFDSNPPLIVWISAVPVRLGDLLHLPAPALGKLLVLLAEAASATLSLHHLRRLLPPAQPAPAAPTLPAPTFPAQTFPAQTSPAHISPSLASPGQTSPARPANPPLTPAQLTWLAFAFITIFAVVPARDLGQRDHLTAILILPYLLAAATAIRASDTPTKTELAPRLLAGLLAAIAICLKPHHALIPIAVELTLLTQNLLPQSSSCTPLAIPLAEPPRTRLLRLVQPLLRPEPPVLLLSGLLFLVAIHRFAPAYFTLALPTLRDTYWAIGHLTPLQLLAEALQLHLLAALTLLLFFRSRASTRHDPLRPAIRLLLVAALAATAAYYLQATGWYYQQLPAISLFSSALALQLLHPRTLLPNLPQRPLPHWLPRATAALSLLALALTTHFTGYPFSLDRSFALSSPDPTFFAHLPPDTPVAILTTSVDDTMMPTARFHLLWSQRTNNVWTLPAILRTEDPQGAPPRHTIPPARLLALEHQQHAWMAEDLTHWRPDLILVARCQAPEVHCQELEDRHDNLLAWFLQDPAFQGIWKSYRYLRTSGAYDAYTRTPNLEHP